MLTTDVICQQVIWQCPGLGSYIPGTSSCELQNIFTLPNFPGPQLTLTVLPLFVIITDLLVCVSTYVQIYSGCWLSLELQWTKPKLGTACVKTKIPWWWHPRSAETWRKEILDQMCLVRWAEFITMFTDTCHWSLSWAQRTNTSFQLISL